MDHIDDKERTILREALWRYAEQHGIGSLTLWKRIARFSTRNTSFSHSTLQRFMRGTGPRTNDPDVALIRDFLKAEMADYPADAVATSLVRFFNLSPSERDFAGEHHIRAARNKQTGQLSIVRLSEHHYRTIERNPDHSIYDGVMVCGTTMAMIVARDRLTGDARNYSLDPNKPRLQGVRMDQTADTMDSIFVEMVSATR